MKKQTPDVLVPYFGAYECRGYGCAFTEEELAKAGYKGREYKLGERCVAEKTTRRTLRRREDDDERTIDGRI